MIEIDDLHIAFGRRTVIDGASLRIGNGEIVALVGANGSGKTSLFRAIAGAVKPKAGSIVVDGQPQVFGHMPVPVSYVSDRRIVWPSFTPRRIMRRFVAIHGIERRTGEAMIERIVADLRMEDYVDKRQSKLSTGQAAKFAVARMLIHPFPVVLLDEPTAGLDFNAALLVRKQVIRLAEAGHSVFVTTHNMDEIVNLSHRALVLRDGRIVLAADAVEMVARAGELPDLIGTAV